MKILALDISSTCTGYTKYELSGTNKIKHIETSHIKPKGKDIYSRMVSLNTTMTDLGLYKWPDVCIIEGFAFAGSKLAQLAEVNGIFKYNLTINNVPFETVAPATVKKQVTGNGRAKKEEVRSTLEKIPLFKNCKFNNEDESDSAALGYGWIQKKIGESK